MHADSWSHVALAATTAVLSKQEVFQTKATFAHRHGDAFDAIITCHMEYTSGPIPTAATIYAQTC